MIDYTAAGFTLLQGAHLYAPEDRGICDVLVANGKIIAVASNIPSDIVPDCTVVDLSGQILCPGFIDQHVHLIGGGGEAGPTTRTPEVALSRLTEAGVTSVVGLLGTDSISRHPESLLAKTRALNEEGISAWMRALRSSAFFSPEGAWAKISSGSLCSMEITGTFVERPSSSRRPVGSRKDTITSGFSNAITRSS